MLKSFVKVLMVLTGLVWAGLACAVGFGSANVSSALGQPLKVEIALKDVDGATSGLSARLASPDAFKAAGLDYPYHLSRLKFEIVTRNGQTYIEVTSKEAVNDSFINLLVELSWSSGKLLREYTFLLDPPDYKPEMPKGEQVAPIEPVVVPVQPAEAPAVAPLPPTLAASAPVETAPAAAASAPAAAPTMAAQAGAASAPAVTEEEAPASAPAAAAPAAQPEAAEQAPEQPAEQPARAAAVAKPKAAPETIKVRRGDTLSKIAARVAEPDVTLEQMLVALYRANVRQFDGKNMNRLRAGKILRMPDEDAFEHLSNREAAKEIRVQTANWNAYRQKLAASVAPVSEQPKQAAGGKISTQVVDQTPVQKPGTGATLQISRGEALGAGGKAPAGQPAKEEAVAREQAAKEDQQRIARLEKQIQDINKVQEMKKESLVDLKGGVQPPSAVAAASAPASGVARAKPKAPMAKPLPAPEPSILDSILAPITESDLAKEYPMLKDPLYLAGGLGVVVLLIGGGVYMVRRRAGGGGVRPKKKKLISKKS